MAFWLESGGCSPLRGGIINRTGTRTRNRTRNRTRTRTGTITITYSGIITTTFITRKIIKKKWRT
jgi:carbohydrate-binding DOMON domain-containing protein